MTCLKIMECEYDTPSSLYSIAEGTPSIMHECDLRGHTAFLTVYIHCYNPTAGYMLHSCAADRESVALNSLRPTV